MTWAELRGHQEVVERFRRAVARGRLASSFLFIGMPGIGKATFARKLAQALLCELHDETQLDPCGHCPSCQRVAARTHPDLIIIQKPPDKSFIPLELFIGDREHRMQEGLCHDISLKPFQGRRKVAVIEDADYLNAEGANCLLKTLEEPPADSLLILIGTSAQRQLPTIRSRCQIVRFQPLDEADVAELLLLHGLVQEPGRAAQLAALSQGSLERAQTLLDADLLAFREQLLGQLSAPPWQPADLHPSVCKFVDAAGKETAPRRARLRQVIGYAADLYAETLRVLTERAARGDDSLRRAVLALSSDWKWGSPGIALCLEACLDCLTYIDANATPNTIIEYWLDELAQISRTGLSTPAADRLLS